jgi:hypothetical protein
MATKAVHLDVHEGLGTDEFLGALMRFIARRGCPKLLRSDNGTNFKGAQRTLSEEFKMMNHYRIQDSLLPFGIEWRFNPPWTPTAGGLWERQIQTVKRVLHDVLCLRPFVTFDMIRTFFCAAEVIMNERPLVKHDTDDPNEVEALTPQHFLLPQAVVLPMADDDRERNRLDRRHQRHLRGRVHKEICHMRRLFSYRWKREYLSTLQERSVWQGEGKNVEVGDVVMSTVPARAFRLARVLKAQPGPDGRVRFVTVAYGDKNLKLHETEVSVRDLAVLEGVLDEDSKQGWPPKELISKRRTENYMYEQDAKQLRAGNNHDTPRNAWTNRLRRL